MSQSLDDLAPGVRERAYLTLAYARDHGIDVQVTSTRRTRAEQAALRERYEQAIANGTFGQPGSVEYPANRAGDSAHQYGLAFDSVPVRPDHADDWIEVRKSFGWRVPYNDPVHAELPAWREAVRYLRSLGYDLATLR